MGGFDRRIRQMLVVGGVVIAFSAGVGLRAEEMAAGVPDAKGYLSLVRAGSKPYRSMETHYKVEVISDVEQEPQETAEIVSRWTPERSYYHEVATIEDPGPYVPARIERQEADAPEGSKAFELDDRKTRTGRVGRGEVGIRRGDMRAWMWDSAALSFLEEVGGTVEHGGEPGLLVATTKPISKRGYFFIIVIDANKGNLPRSFTTKEAGLVTHEEIFSDFRQLEGGLWLPFKFVSAYHSFPQALKAETGAVYMEHERYVFTVEAAKINVRFPAEEMDFSFPAGTFVDDLVSGKSYTVRKSDLRAGRGARAETATGAGSLATVTAPRSWGPVFILWMCVAVGVGMALLVGVWGYLYWRGMGAAGSEE